MRRFVEGMDRGQSTLFPECLEDWIDENNPVQVIDVFVDELDLAELGFDGITPEATGRPSYHPSVLLKLYIYGYLNRVQSSRRLEREAGRNVEVMWLTGRLVPDHKTIADFRKDNGEAIRSVCARFIMLCRALDLFAEVSVAIDGSKFKAVNNRDKNFTRAKMERRMAQIEESVARYLRQLDSADRQEPSEARTTKMARLKEKIAKLKEEMQRLRGLTARMLATADQQISLTDPDSRSMATSGRGSGIVGYNVQVAVDTEHHLIIRAQLARMAKQTKATLERTDLDVIADRGYFSSEEILECDNAGITVTLPKPMTSNPKRFGKQDFRYVAEEDVYICPAGERLTHSFTTQEHGLVLRRYLTNVCQSCAIKHRCTTAKERRITRWEHEHMLEAVQRPARRASGENAPTARNGRTSLRYNKGPNGSDPFLDEDVAAGCLRDGTTRSGLQPHPRNEHHGYPAAHGSDQNIVRPGKAQLSPTCEGHQKLHFPPILQSVLTRPRPN
jgi:transposase